MNKYIFTGFLLAIFGLSLVLSSCDDAKEDNLTPTTVYFVKNDIQPLKMYNKGGDTSYKYNLDIYKAGAINNEAFVKIAVMTEEELSAYNTQNETNYELLDKEVYNIQKLEVSFSADQKDVNQLIDIDFNPAKLASGEMNKVLPIKIQEASVNTNQKKSICIINPQTVDPSFSLEVPKVEIVSFEKGEMKVLTRDISVIFDIDVNEWDIEIELDIDEEYVNTYNQIHQTKYTIPKANMFSLERAKNMAFGETTMSFSLNVFQRYLEGSHMIPVKLKRSSKYGVNKEEYFILILNIISQQLPRENWTIADFNTEEATGENGGRNGRAIHAIDNDLNTFWHSKWQGGKDPLPHYMVIDMQENFTVTEIELRQRGAGNDSQTKGGKFYLSEDNSHWVEIGRFQMEKSGDFQTFKVTETAGRYLKVYIDEAYSYDNTTSLSEVLARGY